MPVRETTSEYTRDMKTTFMCWLTHSLTPCSSRSRRAETSSASWDVLHVVWKPVVQYGIHNSSPLAPVLSQIRPVRTFPSCFLKSILILSSRLHLVHPSYVFPLGFPTKTLRTFFSFHSFIFSLLIWCLKCLLLGMVWNKEMLYHHCFSTVL